MSVVLQELSAKKTNINFKANSRVYNKNNKTKAPIHNFYDNSACLQMYNKIPVEAPCIMFPF